MLQRQNRRPRRCGGLALVVELPLVMIVMLLLSHLLPLVRADIVELANIVIDPSPFALHYSDDTLKGPNALISLKGLIFHTMDFLPGHEGDEQGSGGGVGDDVTEGYIDDSDNNAARQTLAPTPTPLPPSDGADQTNSTNSTSPFPADDQGGSTPEGAGNDDGATNSTNSTTSEPGDGTGAGDDEGDGGLDNNRTSSNTTTSDDTNTVESGNSTVDTDDTDEGSTSGINITADGGDGSSSPNVTDTSGAPTTDDAGSGGGGGDSVNSGNGTEGMGGADDTSGATIPDDAGGGDSGSNSSGTGGGDDTPGATTTDDFGGGGYGTRFLDGGMDISGATQIDVIVFKLPDDCVYTKMGCDWTTLGIGVKLPSEIDAIRWCCTTEVKDLGLCAADGHDQQLGRLILNTTTYKGYHRWIDVPTQGSMSKTLKEAEFIVQDSGTWVLAFANCNVRGRPVVLSGSAVFESEYGYLPAELEPYMYGATVVMVVYAILFLWYLCRMRTYAYARIPIEKWILGTIFIGLLEMIFRTADYFLWNSTGYQNFGVAVTGILFGVVKNAISRCLVLMVSLGWGVTTDTLSRLTLTLIILLGLAYVVVGAAIDISLIVVIEDMKTMTFSQEMEIFDEIETMNAILTGISVAFSVWIVVALLCTIVRLRRDRQSRKLIRYQSLTGILSVSILVNSLVAYFAMVHGQDMHSERVVEAVSEAIYLVLLIGVACLWRPNESAREYAFAMEISSFDRGGSDLELTVVPSGFDDREGNGSSYYSGAMNDGGFKESSRPYRAPPSSSFT